jgi:hypothetical protein
MLVLANAGWIGKNGWARMLLNEFKSVSIEKVYLFGGCALCRVGELRVAVLVLMASW